MLFIRVFARVEKRISVKQLEIVKQDGDGRDGVNKNFEPSKHSTGIKFSWYVLSEILKILSKEEFWRYTL